MGDQDLIRDGSGREGRIRAEYKAMRRRSRYCGGFTPPWMTLARKHKMSIQAIKQICGKKLN